MKILIVGCGYLGSLLGKNLSRKGAEVWGLRRTSFTSEGVRPIVADLLDTESLKNLPQVDSVVLCQAPSGDKENYEDSYFKGTRNLISMIENKKPKKLLFVSSASVYGTEDGSWVDESTPPSPPDEDAKWILETERLVLQQKSIILRLGGIYGPGRNRLKQIKEGKLKAAFDDTYMNRIHVEDAAAAVELLLEKGKAGEIYLGADEHPSARQEFYSWIFEQLNLQKPPVNGKSEKPFHGSNKRCSNKKLKALGMKFKYPSFKEGYAPFFAELK